MGSVFASSTLSGVVSAGAAIETLFTAGEGKKGGGVRSVQLLFLKCTTVLASGAVFLGERGHIYNFMPEYEWTNCLENER